MFICIYVYMYIYIFLDRGRGEEKLLRGGGGVFSGTINCPLPERVCSTRPEFLDHFDKKNVEKPAKAEPEQPVEVKPVEAKKEEPAPPSPSLQRQLHQIAGQRS
jgi:hypothetical protein